MNENQLVTGSGDGSIKLWDVGLNVSVTEPSNIRFGSDKFERTILFNHFTNILEKFIRLIGTILTKNFSSLPLGTILSKW
jgi:hypothetical protein